MERSKSHELLSPVERVLNHLKGVRSSLRGWVACCPAHADREPSLSIGEGDEGQVLLKCFAGCSLEHIVAAMGLTVTDLFPASTPSSSTGQEAGAAAQGRPSLSLLTLAQDKRLPWQFLFSLGVMDNDTGGVEIPYHLPDGTLAPRHRIRTALTAKDGSYWSKGQGPIVPYGLERLAEAKKAGYLVLVEGESDCWTLWYHHLPALGIPGAEMAGKLEEAMLEGIDRLYVIQEPDAGGEAFVSNVRHRLEAWHWQGKAFIVTLNGAKDPSALHQRELRTFPSAFQQALEQAEPLFFFRSSPSPTPSGDTAPPSLPAIFSLQDLLSWDLPPVRWAVPDILPEGLTLLAGKPKLGKSWLALSTALAIAAGGVALGKQPVQQGEVLYLALEDNARRLQARSRQLLTSMTGVPHGIDFALSWPRLNEGGVECLEAYLKEHPQVRLVVIDTWAKVAPRATNRQSSQYAGDYEALTPLKTLADTYHVSILAVHHLRKMGSTDVLDEITGSIGITGAVDGTLILKRDRGQQKATLFVTGRDVEHEQHLALSFDPSTALWTLVGTAEEVCRSKERQAILTVLKEQLPGGLSPREVALALEKNYHTTRTLLRKMEEAGDIISTGTHYRACSHETNETTPTPAATPNAKGKVDDTDYTDYSDYGEDITVRKNATCSHVPAETTKSRTAASPTAGAALTPPMNTITPAFVQPEHLSATQLGQESVCHQSSQRIEGGNTSMQHPSQQDHHCHDHHHRNQCNQTSEAVTQPQQEAQVRSAREEQKAAEIPHVPLTIREQQQCPHHPQERRVRFDPTGQAWCNHLNCWDCYRLMHIGNALGYPCLIDRGGARLIAPGQEAWSDFARTQRPFPVMDATEEAILACRRLGIPVPDLSAEVARLHTVHPTFPGPGTA